jgi:hypothetical protein
MKVLQKHSLLAIIFCILFCDVRIGLIFKNFVLCDTPVLGDDFILGSQCCGTVTIYYGSGSVSGSDF